MHRVVYNSPNGLTAGSDSPVRVNLSFGIESQKSGPRELSKISRIIQSERPPDLIMDLSVERIASEPWEAIRSVFEGPIGVLPHYLVFSHNFGLESRTLLSRIEYVLSHGVNFITIHCSPTVELFAFARRKRRIPITSRGGSIVVRDMIINNRTQSVFAELFEDICSIVTQYGAVINLGTAFRAASVAEGFDTVMREELRIQRTFVERAQEKGVQIVLEGPGHIRLDQIAEYWSVAGPMGVTPMPLGPIVSDRYSGMDHVANAIGAAHLMSLCRGGIINAVTAAEHLGGVPNIRQMEEGLRSAQVAAQAASLCYHNGAFAAEDLVSQRRAAVESCVLDGKEAGCSRCQHLCPLITASFDMIERK